MHVGSAIIDDKLCDVDKGFVPINDRGFLFGHAVFETILVLHGKVVFWNEHWKRLLNGARDSRIALPDEKYIWSLVENCVKDNINKSGYVSDKMQVKVMLTGGDSHLLWENTGHDVSPRSIIICRNISGLSPEVYENGLGLYLVPDSRPETRLAVKGTSYIINMLALATAKEQGYDDALFFNKKNEITESTTANFLWLNKENEICTTVSEGRCLPGTTLQGFAAACKKLGVIIKEGLVHLDELQSQKLPCIISATRGVVPVSKINNLKFDVEQYSSMIQKWNQDLVKEQILTSKPLK